MLLCLQLFLQQRMSSIVPEDNARRRVAGQNTERLGHQHELRKRLDADLLHDLLAMCLDSARRGTQFTSDLLVHLASHDSLEDLSLAGSERGYQSSQRILPIILSARCLRAKHRAFDGVD